MNLELGIVQECTPEGCRVRLLGKNNVIQAAFSPAVKDRVRIRQRQLVAINTEGPPEIAWRWFRGTVEEVNDGAVGVRRADMTEGCHVTMSTWHTPAMPAIGDTVFYTRVDDWEVADLVHGDAPANPSALATRYYPAIERAYASAT